jgi:ribosomal protein S18 acetylase RimI-like enzyme
VTATLPAGLRIARGTPEDAAELAAVGVAADVEEHGEPDYDEAEAAADLADPAGEWWLARDGDGRLVGYAWTGVVSGHTAAHLDVVTDPTADPTLGPALLDLVIRRGRERASGRPLHVFVPAHGGRRTEWVRAAGGRPVRRFSRMLIDFTDQPPTVSPLPDGAEIIRPPESEADLRAMHGVLDDAFADHFGTEPSRYDDWLTRNRARAGYTPDLWWLVRVDGEPAAALLGREMPGMGWVQRLGTRPDYRGRGLATHLLRLAFAAMHDRGWRRVGLGVDTENTTGALRLYESIGMRPSMQRDLYEISA